MKIGAFAKQNQVSIDTIRHYIDLELLIPQKKNKQYEFDRQCQNDFNEILFLKSLGFALHEIKNIFIVKHLGKMTSFQEDEYYKNIFQAKYQRTQIEIEKLNGEQSRLKEELHKLEVKNEHRSFKMGIQLSWMHYLACDRCGGPLALKPGVVEDNMILSGKLSCKCGNEYSVQDGILFAFGGLNDGDPPLDVLSYIQNTDTEYLNRIYKALEWNAQHVHSENLAEKVILELGSGSGFFLRRIYDNLPDDAVYIAADHDPGKLRFLKGILEKAEKRKGILFICCDFPHIPLKTRSVDVSYDFTGTSNFSFEHGEFLLRLVERFLKTEAELLGSYIIFRNFSPDSMVPVKFRPNFQIHSLKKQIEELGFIREDEYTSNVVTKGGIYENYFRSGEKVLNYSFAGKRSG
ncbi:MerR family transcriptional regulator [Desulfosporosinus sp. PR]|uniref:MerR family transcriptional regulator n=1 Tax=Candidatus Desulfosporosinus nitrosoreducens TaxID=3401928 RepID=UPI0027F2C543|nr:MerR family transcriptional regulator [Desulfosporosinus sp. PR]MDQ7096728.1 MerR family transcriptional regulator [Desulfosporosinus sp. PR]